MHEARNPVKSLRTAITIIEAIQERGEAGVTELADDLSPSKGTIYNHLATLEENGYIVNIDGKYQLGLKFVDIAHDVRDRIEIYDLVRDEIDQLAEKSGELALFTVEEQQKGVCLYMARGGNAVKTELYVGYRNELYHTAVGKAILAHKPPEEIDAVLSGAKFEALTDRTITDASELRDELADIRESGLAYNREETMPGLTGVGDAIQNRDEEVYGAMSVIGPTSRMTEERLEEIAEMINHSVNVIEVNSTSL